jgi:hypothetical protein
MTQEEIRTVIREEVQSAIKGFFSAAVSEIVDTEEAMRFLGVEHRTTLTRYHRQGLPYIKGTPNRYVKSDLIEFAMKKRICQKP